MAQICKVGYLIANLKKLQFQIKFEKKIIKSESWFIS